MANKKVLALLQVCLIIVEVFPEDQGQYICVAENPAGQATTSAYLSIMESVETTLQLEPQAMDQVDTVVPEGQEITITLGAPIQPEEQQPMEVEETKVTNSYINGNPILLRPFVM
jgi:hypothetical protein